MLRIRETLALALVATLGCEVADFEIARRGTAVIPRDQLAADIDMLRLDDMEIVLAELEDTHDIGREDMSEADITRFTLTVLDPPDADLAFADRIEIFAEAPGLESVRIAWQDEFPAGEGVIELETDDVDLRSYVAAPSVRLVARVDGRAPRTDVRVQASADLHIGVTLRGACDHAG